MYLSNYVLSCMKRYTKTRMEKYKNNVKMYKKTNVQLFILVKIIIFLFGDVKFLSIRRNGDIFSKLKGVYSYESEKTT